MPELPDIEAYVHALRPRIVGHRLLGVRLGSPFLLRTVDPPLESAAGKSVDAVNRLGKRIVLELTGGPVLAIHLMIAGRLHWKAPGAALPGRRGLAALDADTGTLLLTEAGSTRRAALHVLASAADLSALDRGGIEVLEADLPSFAARLRTERHTLKRALTDPRLFSGIGNAYSDEILHTAGLSPVAMTTALADADVARLFDATRAVLGTWRDRLCAEAEHGFPEKVTAFRPEMAVHGRFGLPCPRCRTAVQRIRYAKNETDYCPACQTGGRILADRALSRLLRSDWPRSLEELEDRPLPGTGGAPRG